MTGNEYQSLAMRTNDRKATERISDKFDLLKFCKKNNIASALQDYDLGGIFNSCLGLSGEVGEFNDIIKKWIFHAKRKKYVKFSITYTLKDMDISPKAFKHVVRQAKDQVYMPDEKERMEMYLRNHLDIVNLGLLFMFKTGVRVGELSALKRKDVENYTVAINSTETRYRDDDGFHYDVKDFPKSEAGLRFAILPDKYKWILDEVRKRNPFGQYLFERDGERLKSYNFRERLRYICEHELRMKVKSPHKIRKTYGSILLDGKVKESTILDTMGHTDISCTKDHYYFDRTGIEEKRQELDLIEAL